MAAARCPNPQWSPLRRALTAGATATAASSDRPWTRTRPEPRRRAGAGAGAGSRFRRARPPAARRCARPDRPPGRALHRWAQGFQLHRLTRLRPRQAPAPVRRARTARGSRLLRGLALQFCARLRDQGGFAGGELVLGHGHALSLQGNEGIQVGTEGSHPFLCPSCSPKSDRSKMVFATAFYKSTMSNCSWL